MMINIKEIANFFNHCNLSYGKILGTVILKWKTVLLISISFAFLGWFDSYSKLHKYHVVTRISLSKIFDISYFSSLPSRERTIDDPNIFLMYIQNSKNYEAIAYDSCGFNNENPAFNSFFERFISIRLETTPLINYRVEMKGYNLDFMKNCIQGISQNILSFQAKLLQDHVNLIREELIAIEKNIDSLRGSQREYPVGKCNIETEELKFLLPISIQLQAMLKHSKLNSGKILSSVEVIKAPSKNGVSTLLGFLFGLFIAIIFIAHKEIYILIKKSFNERDI
jgi:hypothetical protein